MKPRKIELRFWEGPAGFSLRDIAFQGDLLSLQDYELIGDQALYDQDGHIVYLTETFVDFPEPFEDYIREARRLNIPGRYDVPELGLKDATLVEVLEAVKRYFQSRLS